MPAKQTIAQDDPDLGIEALNYDPGKWLEQMEMHERNRSPWVIRGCYPSEVVREYFLNPSNLEDIKTLRQVLRALLPQGSGSVGSDVAYLEADHENIVRRFAHGKEKTEYERRLVSSVFDKNIAPIPDLTWLIDLAFVSPLVAIQTARGFLEIHSKILNKPTIDGLSDFMESVRAHFGLDIGNSSDVDLLRSLSSRDLEYLVAVLWAGMGYKVSVTPATKDGGKDIIAVDSREGKEVTIYIECKQWTKRVDVSPVRELLGIINKEQVNKGIVVGPSGFTAGKLSAVETATSTPLIELIDATGLSKLLRNTYGPNWAEKLDSLIELGRSYS